MRGVRETARPEWFGNVPVTLAVGKYFQSEDVKSEETTGRSEMFWIAN